MKFKSLLLGSAVAVVAVSGAQAADAPVVIYPEPVAEPMEYVRVCDVYGAGFFYIPGTETCLKIGGYVRYQIDWADNDDGWKKLARGSITLDARTETEYGTLGGFIEVRGDAYSGYQGINLEDPAYDPIDSAVASVFRGVYLQQAIISLGGLSMGLSDTLYDAGLSGEFDSGGGDLVHFMRYTYDAANGMYASLALEEADYDYDYTPNVVANVGLAQGWGTLNLWGAYDATAEEFGVKAIATMRAMDAISLELMGTYESGQNFYSVSHDGSSGGYEYSAGAYAKYDFSPRASFGLGGQYFMSNHLTGADDYAVGAVLDYAIVKDFNTKIAVNYFDGDSVDEGYLKGFVRFQRNF
ncbi:porin [Nitratireductor basaltis]|uniref:Porin n=1 Tax=Nitratireductor basaltis TaxID=472175 RepID=A0A084UCB2_9HYPH|nr:porin [Nitratireductor basaltis]KFB10598.1 Porin precursor [Nitratireductor basaltis]